MSDIPEVWDPEPLRALLSSIFADSDERSEERAMCPSSLPDQHLRFIREAANYLDRPSFLMRLADLAGRPFESVANAIVPTKVAEISHEALLGLTRVSIATLSTGSRDGEFDFSKADAVASWQAFWTKFAVAVTGAGGGAFGFPSLAIELPISTGIMFRSIAATARAFGEDLNDPVTHLECLTDFSMGGSRATEAMESSYLTARFAMTKTIQEAAQFLARESAVSVAEAIARGTAPVLVRFISQVAARFNVVVTEKLMVQGMPAIGAVTGALINVAFCDHFNKVARFHFGIRELERRFGMELVQSCYRDALKDSSS